MSNSQCIVDIQLLKDCIYAFNEIPNRRLSNGTKTYDLASRLDHVLADVKAPQPTSSPVPYS